MWCCSLGAEHDRRVGTKRFLLDATVLTVASSGLSSMFLVCPYVKHFYIEPYYCAANQGRSQWQSTCHTLL